LRPRPGADGVDHAAGGQADDAPDDCGGHHYDQAQRTADRAQHAGRRVAHRRARSRATHRAHHLAAAAACRFFNRTVVLARRSRATDQQRAHEQRDFLHVTKQNALHARRLTR